MAALFVAYFLLWVLEGFVMKFLAVYEEPFWRTDGLSGEGFAPHQFVRELYDNSPPSASVGVLCTFLPGFSGTVLTFTVRLLVVLALTVGLAWLVDHRLHTWLAARLRRPR